MCVCNLCERKRRRFSCVCVHVWMDVFSMKEFQDDLWKNSLSQQFFCLLAGQLKSLLQHKGVKQLLWYSNMFQVWLLYAITATNKFLIRHFYKIVGISPSDWFVPVFLSSSFISLSFFYWSIVPVEVFYLSGFHYNNNVSDNNSKYFSNIWFHIGHILLGAGEKCCQ